MTCALPRRLHRVLLDAGCQFAQYAKAYASLLERDRAAMITAAERIAAINPNAAYMPGCAGFWLCIAGEYPRGMELFERGAAARWPVRPR